MLGATYAAFVLLCVASLALAWLASRARLGTDAVRNPTYRNFQLHFYAPYFLALAADWLQGPYLYKLYSHYGFLEPQIAVLYVCGFAAGLLLAPFVGTLAERLGGRRTSCVLFSLLCAASCLLKLSRGYFVLLVARILGGISTALLFTAHETWYQHEHRQIHDFPAEWVDGTLAEVALWNGAIAAVAGVVANVAAETLDFGPVAPFVLAVPFLAVSGALIVWRWDENRSTTKVGLRRSCIEGLQCLLSDRKVLLLAAIQALFESTVYMFVFLWTPVLDPWNAPLGIAFSSFMLASLAGSSLYRLATSPSRPLVQPTHALLLSVALALGAFVQLVWSTAPPNASPYRSLLAFLAFEFAVGVYFPAVAFLRSKVIPEKSQAGVLGWLRVPLNTFTCLGLLALHDADVRTGPRDVFTICAGLMLATLVASLVFCWMSRQDEQQVQESQQQQQQEPQQQESQQTPFDSLSSPVQ
ncbi:molybdate-anion transporter [Lampetra fluviatilis]